MAKNLIQWNPEDKELWEKEYSKVAWRNLWISIPCLLCGFAVWIYWSVITVQMLNIGFPFTPEQLFALSAIAGLSGATLRIPSSFFIRLSGGRNTIFFTTALLLIPVLGTGFALQSIETPLWAFQLLALLSGIGGGNFASSMSNISFFFPKRVQGLSLGLNAGLGNFGVTLTQIFIPLIMTVAAFGGASMVLKGDSGTLIGRIPAGTATYIQNAGFLWAAIIFPIVILSWILMNNIITKDVSPKLSNPFLSMMKIAIMLMIGLVSATLALWFILPENSGGNGWGVSKWIVLPILVVAVLYLLKMIPGDIKNNLSRQYEIFKNPHTWIMTVIYTMTFGSFIGFSAAFPLAIQVIFGFQHVVQDGVMTHNLVNPQGPSALTYAWIGPFIGALIRPIGGWISDKLGGAFVTQICSLVMIGAGVGAAYFMKIAYASATPEQHFIPFLLLFLILFFASGIGNGSTFRTISKIFNKEQAGPVLGWTSAIGAYGAFIIPQIFGEQIQQRTPEVAIYSLIVFYVLCFVLNWYAYLRKNAQHKNP